MFHSYRQAVDYLYSNLPMFQRVGAAAFKKDLANTIKLCEALGNPHTKYKSIHIAGTNGKGSTSHFLASVLQSTGYKTGLYTSPHLKEFTERIKVNGNEVDQEFVVEFVNRLRPVIEEIKPSFFEITVAMAFDYFARQRVDIAVVEVGLGGRLDSTNVITPVLSVITNIGLDHTDLLGDTLEKIAFEKAGIIKPNVPVVVSERQAEVEKVFEDVARANNSVLTFASDRFNVEVENDNVSVEEDKALLMKFRTPLTGGYQRKNIGGALEAVKRLRLSGLHIPDKALQEGFEKVVQHTGLKGRWQKLGANPLTVCDTGHNADGIKEVVKQLAHCRYEKLYMVWGMVKDKDASTILQLLPKDAYYYFCQATIPRALDAELLARTAGESGLRGEVVRDVNDALAGARRVARPGDMIFVGGSTFVVAELNEL